MINFEMKELASVPAGEYRVRRLSPWWKLLGQRERTGWLTIERNSKGHTDVMWTSGRHDHDAFSGPALSLTISPSGTIVCYMESVLRIHIRWGYGRGDDSELLKAKEFARWAHEKLCCQEEKA